MDSTYLCVTRRVKWPLHDNRRASGRERTGMVVRRVDVGVPLLARSGLCSICPSLLCSVAVILRLHLIAVLRVQ